MHKLPRLAVAAVILSHDLKHVVLIRRGKPPADGQWSLPGGSVELAESLTQACAREVLEETALEINPQGVVKIVERVICNAEREIEFHYVIVDFWAITDLACKPEARTDARDAAWVNLDQLPQLDTTRHLDQVVGRAVSLAQAQPPDLPLLDILPALDAEQ